MKTRFPIPVALALFLAFSLPACLAAPPVSGGAAPTPRAHLEARWFFCFGYGRTRKDVDRIKALVDIAAAHGLNGMVLSSFGMDSVTSWKPADFALLREVADHCAEKHIELIRICFLRTQLR